MQVVPTCRFEVEFEFEFEFDMLLVVGKHSIVSIEVKHFISFDIGFFFLFFFGLV